MRETHRYLSVRGPEAQRLRPLLFFGFEFCLISGALAKIPVEKKCLNLMKVFATSPERKFCRGRNIPFVRVWASVRCEVPNFVRGWGSFAHGRSLHGRVPQQSAGHSAVRRWSGRRHEFVDCDNVFLRFDRAINISGGARLVLAFLGEIHKILPSMRGTLA